MNLLLTPVGQNNNFILQADRKHSLSIKALSYWILIKSQPTADLSNFYQILWGDPKEIFYLERNTYRSGKKCYSYSPCDTLCNFICLILDRNRYPTNIDYIVGKLLRERLISYRNPIV